MTIEDRALHVACPTCGAASGRRCISNHKLKHSDVPRYFVAPHRARKLALRAQEAK